jgi:methyl-accepting chemotaxis protein
MRNLKLWQKLALMGAVFMIPFAAVTYKMTSSINALGVDFARQEVSGLEYYRPLAVLLRDLQLHRDVANGLLNGEASFEERLTRKRADVENDVKAVDEVNGRLQDTLQTGDRWTAVRTATLDLLKASPSLSADQSFARHSALIDDVIL